MLQICLSLWKWPISAVMCPKMTLWLNWLYHFSATGRAGQPSLSSSLFSSVKAAFFFFFFLWEILFYWSSIIEQPQSFWPSFVSIRVLVKCCCSGFSHCRIHLHLCVVKSPFISSGYTFPELSSSFSGWPVVGVLYLPERSCEPVWHAQFQDNIFSLFLSTVILPNFYLLCLLVSQLAVVFVVFFVLTLW